jgi:hypothetical protein
MLNIKFDLTQNIKDKYKKLLCNTKFEDGMTIKDKIENEDIFSEYSFDDIIFAEPKSLQKLIQDIENKNLNKDKLKKIFKYDGKYQPIIANFFEQNIKPRTCYYCNIDFINVYEVDNENKNKFTIDHFFDKGSYPYLALSLYNLIPSCYVCNSKIKRDINFYENDKLKDTNPYLETFDFNEKVKFKLFLSDSCKDLNIKSKDDIDIPLKERYSDKYDKYTKVFKLNERYEAHKDIVYEMIKNAELYPLSRLKELENITGIPYQQIRKDIFNLIDDNEDLSKKPFSKLTKDISQELGLI